MPSSVEVFILLTIDQFKFAFQYNIIFVFTFLFGLTFLSIVNSSVYARLYDVFYTVSAFSHSLFPFYSLFKGSNYNGIITRFNSCSCSQKEWSSFIHGVQSLLLSQSIIFIRVFILHLSLSFFHFLLHLNDDDVLLI